VTQLVLPIHECAAEPLQDVAVSVAAPTTVVAVAIESIAEPLHFSIDPADSGAALTETFCLCVWV
jgi:hypothetical protein